MFEASEGRKIQDHEVVSRLKAYPIQTAKTGANGGSMFTEWNFTAAAHVVNKLANDNEIVQVVQTLESMYRLDSCLNSLVKLEKLATKPTGKEARRWIFACLLDHLQHGLVENEQVSRSWLCGDKHATGMIVLLEWKKKMLDYMDTLMLEAKLSPDDRRVIKSQLKDPKSFREACEERVQWQAELNRSGQECVRFVQDVVYLRTFDNLLKGAIKTVNTAPETLLEIESIAERWQHVKDTRQNEIVQETATDNADAEVEEQGGDEGDDGFLALAHKQPHLLEHKSPLYWRSVANKNVRMYLTFVTEGKTDQNLVQQVEQSPIASMTPELGKTSVLVHLDTSLLGEGPGPDCQNGLRHKKWKVDTWSWIFNVFFCCRKFLIFSISTSIFIFYKP